MCDWCEIDEGRDFLAADGRWDWIVTNPPWSQFRPFLAKSMQVADNVVFLVTMNHFFTKARMRDVAAAGFGFVEALLVETPPEPWPQSGFQVAAVHLRKGHRGPMTFSYKKVSDSPPLASDNTKTANGESLTFLLGAIMTIHNIIQLSEIIHLIQGEAPWSVATQSWPEHWSNPTHSLQWYIDANWLIRSGELIYDPRQAPNDKDHV